MKKKLALTLSLSLLISLSFAQTKLIAHKSHSGSKQHFKKSLSNNLFNNSSSNFGAAPERYVKHSQLDSVIFISKSKAILVTSTCWKDVYTSDTTSKWKPGREVVMNHPLFSKQHSLDSIKKVLSSQYYFTNSIKKVVFVGYDNKKTIEKTSIKENSVPIINTLNKNNNQPNAPIILLIISAFSIMLIGFINFKLNKNKSIITI